MAKRKEKTHKKVVIISVCAFVCDDGTFRESASHVDLTFLARSDWVIVFSYCHVDI